jgi:hypothetical protein
MTVAAATVLKKGTNDEVLPKFLDGPQQPVTAAI